jgi:hypothetical protein
VGGFILQYLPKQRLCTAKILHVPKANATHVSRARGRLRLLREAIERFQRFGEFAFLN